MNACLIWDADAWLLRAKTPSDETLFTWTYPMFEDWTGSVIVPSEYVFMTNYVEEHIASDERAAIYQGKYNPGPLCSRAVDAWRALPAEEKMDWRNQTIYQLEGHLKEALAQEEAAMGWMTETPDDRYECISADMCKMVRGLIDRYTEKSRLCDRMLAEENAYIF